MLYGDLSKGMVVRLTSGGPQMTVEDYEQPGDWYSSLDRSVVWMLIAYGFKMVL